MKNAVTNKIRLLKDIQPNPDWLKSQRSNLLLEISQSGKSRIRRERLPVFVLPARLLARPNFAFKPVMVSLVLVCLIFGGGFLTVLAAKNSLPGDLLYHVKIAVENTRVKVSTEESKPKLQAEFVGNRVKELTQIVDEEVANPIKKKERVVQAVDKLQAQVVSVKARLDKVRIDTPEKTAEVTDAVNQKLTEAKKTIEEVGSALAIILDDKEKVREITLQMEIKELDEESVEVVFPTIPSAASESEDFEDLELLELEDEESH